MPLSAEPPRKFRNEKSCVVGVRRRRRQGGWGRRLLAVPEAPLGGEGPVVGAHPPQGAARA